MSTSIATILRQAHEFATHQARLKAYWQSGQLLSEQPDICFKTLCAHLSPILQKVVCPYHLREMLRFYQAYPDWQNVPRQLSWAHFRILLRLPDPSTRLFYQQQSLQHHWSTRELQRQLKAHHHQRTRIKLNTTPTPQNLIRDNYVLEFLGLEQHPAYVEKELEDALLDNLQDFILELGSGFSFVARQKHVVTESGKKFYIDLVFYNYLLHCFILLELKIGELSPQDVGQMDLYVRLYDQKLRQSSDSPTLGIILCSTKDHSITRYTMLHDSPQLFASTYQLHLPTDTDWQHCNLHLNA